MNLDFPSDTDLTWQGQRASTCPMESTDNLADQSRNGYSSADSDRRTLANRFDDLYFIQAGDDAIKVGRSFDANERLRTLQCGLAEKRSEAPHA